MDPIYSFLTFLVIVAFVAGIFLADGNLKTIYMMFLALVVIAGVVSINSALRFWLAKPQVSPPAPQSFKPFYVYQDKPSLNHFFPSGYMADHMCVSLDDAWQEEVKEGRSCIRVVYDTDCSRKKRKWAGVYWQYPVNNWGDQKGGHDLTGAQKLVFWARGEEGGEHILEFKVGGLGAKAKYPDSAAAAITHVVLTHEWKEYVIDLRRQDLSRISGGFAWSTSAEVNRGPCVFYLDDIRFE